MNHTEQSGQPQEGIDPLSNASLTKPCGVVTLDVARLRKAGASLQAIGLAAAMLSRDEDASTEDRLSRVYGLDKFRAPKLLRELVVAGFLEVRSGLYHVANDHKG
jgi:hypothetical protein